MENRHIILGDYVISLLRSVILNTKPQDKPADITWLDIYNFANKQNVTNMTYYAIKNMGLSDADIMPFYEDYKKFTIREAKQQLMTERIFSMLEEKEINCMPMKGFCIKNLYPVESMRYSVDTDIYFDSSRAEELNEIMLSLGFTFKKDEYDQLIYHKLPIYNYEMHKNLVEDRIPGFEYFSSSFDRSIPYSDEFKYVRIMSNEDLLIHSVAHFYKHYVGEGAGIRFLLDIYFLTEKLEYDEEYVYKKLDEFSLLEFFKKMKNLSDIWFKSGEYDSNYRKIALFLYSNGVFGNTAVGGINRLNEVDVKKKISKTKKIRNYLSRWFLGVDIMKQIYPILGKAPILLPFCWIHKGIKTLICKPQAIKKQVEVVKKSSYIEEIYKISGVEYDERN